MSPTAITTTYYLIETSFRCSRQIFVDFSRVKLQSFYDLFEHRYHSNQLGIAVQSLFVPLNLNKRISNNLKKKLRSALLTEYWAAE
jgi:hypothetical protein